MSASLIRTELDGPHLTIVLDDAERQNALSPEIVAALDHALEASRGLSSVTISGAHGVFSAGADLKGLSQALAHPPAPGEPDPLQDQNRAGGQFFARLYAHPVATLALIDGSAIGGGMGIACCADIVIATPRARFALSETSLGIPPAQIAPYVVARLGERHATQLALTGARIDGREAARIGLADYYCETEEAVTETLGRLRKQIGRCAPRANAATKRLIQASRDGATPAYVEEAARSFAACLRGPEGREGIAAFLEKRAPNWAGAKP